ncbi:MAG: metallophosphoesterase [Patescibacteria group bacterium]
MLKLIFIFIITIISLILGNYWIYYSIIKFFNILSGPFKTSILAVLIILALSFVITVIMLKIHDNIITRSLYFLGAYWMGLFFYVLMSLVLIWVIYFVGKLLNLDLNMVIVNTIVYGICLIISFYGIYETFNPQLNKIDVRIKNLPDSWQDKTIVQLSDVHLGAIHRPAFLNKIVKQVNELNPDVIVITGDMFDGMDGKLEPFIFGLSSFKAKQGIYFVAGNHEEYLGMQEPLNIIKKANIKILNNEVVNINGLQLVGLAYNNNADIKNLDLNQPSVFLQHMPTDINLNATSTVSHQANIYWQPDVIFDKAIEMGIDLQLSGHTHAGQFFPFNLLTKKIFKNYDYGLHQQGDFQIYISSGTGTWGPPLRIGTKSEIAVIQLKSQ